MRVPVGGARGATAGLLDQSACTTWTIVYVYIATTLRRLLAIRYFECSIENCRIELVFTSINR